MWAWGLDCGSKRTGWAAVNVLTGAFTTNLVAWPAKPGPFALAANYHANERFSGVYLRDRPPCAIGVEWPSGKPNKSLYSHAGTTMAAVASLHRRAPDLRLPLIPEPYWIAVPKWKGAVFGVDNRTSGDGRLFIPWAISLGYDVQDIDQLAALAIAVTAALDVEPELDLTALHPLHSRPEAA